MSPEDRKRPPAAPGKLGRFVDGIRRSPVRTKVLLVLVNAWLAVCVVLVARMDFGGEAGRPRKDEGGRMKAEDGIHPSSFRIHPSEAHDWLADFGDDFGAELRESMAARKVLAPAGAESFQRHDLPELAFAAIDEPIPEAPAEPYVEPDFPDWMLSQRGEAEGDIENAEDEGEGEEEEEVAARPGTASMASASDGLMIAANMTRSRPATTSAGFRASTSSPASGASALRAGANTRRWTTARLTIPIRSPPNITAPVGPVDHRRHLQLQAGAFRTSLAVAAPAMVRQRNTFSVSSNGSRWTRPGRS